MRRRHYLRVTAAGAAGIGLAGCAGGGGGSDGGDGGGSGDGGGGDDGDGSGDGGGDGGSGDGGGSSETATLELWHDKGKNPNWNPAFEETIPVLNDLLSGIEVEAVPYQSTDSYQGALRPVLGSNKGPAVFTWWTGARLRNLIDQGYAQEITDVWQEHIDAGEYSEGMMETFGADGQAYAIPSQLAYWPVWYNTETFDELGVSPPETWDEFQRVSQTIIDESGGETAPVAIPLSPPWTGFIWFEDLLVRQDPAFYNRLCQGEANYTDDPCVETLSLMGDLADRGFFGDVNRAFSLALDDLPKVLEDGSFAMTLMGSWVSSLWTGDLDFSKYDWFPLPPRNQDLGDQLIVEPGPFVPHAGHANTEQVRQVADALLSTEFQQQWNETQGFIAANQQVDTSYLSETKASLADAVANQDYSFPLRYWENTSPEVAVPASKTMKKAFRPGQFSADSVASELDKLRADVYG